MIASEAIEDLQKLMKLYGDLELVYSNDDEGNEFKKVHYNPAAGHFDEHSREWQCVAQFDPDIKIVVNSFCIN